MGVSSSKDNTETINWDNIKTENVSSTLPNFTGLSNDAKQLIASLNIPEITESQTSELTIDHILNTINNGLNKQDKAQFESILEQVSSQSASENMSETSPFISSEMYNYLVNSKTSESEIKQAGGAKKSKSKKGKMVKKGGAWDEDSSTSSTSTTSSSSLSEMLDSTESEIIAQKAKKEQKKMEKKSKASKHTARADSELSGGELSYLSSSAHTGGDLSESDEDSSSSMSSSDASPSEESQSSSSSSSSDEPVREAPKKYNKKYEHTSVTDENSNITTSISVRTSDINMISDY